MRQLRRRFRIRLRRGMTLLEVVLAMGIFFGSFAVLTQLLDTGSRASIRGRLQTQAMLLCQSRMAEVVAGAVPMQAVAGQAYDTAVATDWLWTLQLGAAPHPHLLTLEVTVSHASEELGDDVSFTLRRYIRDPQLYIDAANLAAENAAAAGTGTAQ